MNSLYDTRIIEIDEENISEQALAPIISALKAGELVAIPTETVYGICADLYNEEAVKKIYIAKGRPMDKPLIVQIFSLKELYTLVEEVPENALKLMDKFWPGPLSIVFKKNKNSRHIASAGRDTIAIRMPSHPVFRRVLKLFAGPLVAPSANISGLANPKNAEDVYKDLAGKIPLIVSSGDSKTHLESTLVDLSGDVPQLLRAGAIPRGELEDALPNLEIAVL